MRRLSENSASCRVQTWNRPTFGTLRSCVGYPPCRRSFRSYTHVPSMVSTSPCAAAALPAHFARKKEASVCAGFESSGGVGIDKIAPILESRFSTTRGLSMSHSGSVKHSCSKSSISSWGRSPRACHASLVDSCRNIEVVDTRFHANCSVFRVSGSAADRKSAHVAQASRLGRNQKKLACKPFVYPHE